LTKNINLSLIINRDFTNNSVLLLLLLLLLVLVLLIVSVSDFRFLSVFFDLGESNYIGDIFGGTNFSSGIVGEHNFHFDSYHTLFKEYMSGGGIYEIYFRLSGMEQITLSEFHGFSSLLFQFSGNDNFTSFSLSSSFVVFHNLFDDGVSGKSNGDLS